MIKSKFIFIATISLLFTYISPQSNVIHAEENLYAISPLADHIEWRLQYINGILHKRQYNVSTGSWLAKWIPAN